MSSFNWFNRQYNQPAQSSEPDTPETAPAQSEEEAAPATSTPVNAQEYLSWAKAAYQNIQKRQQIEPTATAQDAAAIAEDQPSPTPEAATPEATPIEGEEVASTGQREALPPDVVGEEAVEPSLASLTQVREESEPEEAIASPSESSDPSPTPDQPGVPLPFWAKAEAEREERLERLKAEAIADPEPVVDPASSTATSPAEGESGVPLDESFIWSAGVLASQGRRPDQVSLEEITWLKRLRQGLEKTRRSLINQLKAIVGQGPLNQDAVMAIESLLLQADVGVDATDFIIESLQAKLRQEVLPPEQAIAYLKQILRDMLDRPYQTYHPTFAPDKDTLNIWLITGVNGAGKTTTIGKIAHVATKSGYRTLIGAADTFRAAAVEQVKVWGQRSQVEVIANPGKNTDPAAVVFDAIAAAKSRNTELLLVDTAGRLQNKKNLMEELGKIRRIIDKQAPGAHIESLLVLDSTLGQNGLRQAEVFADVAQLTGVVLTKLDGTAKGGVALAVVQQLGLPIRFIGAGEGIEDLRPFSSYEFVEALLSG